MVTVYRLTEIGSARRGGVTRSIDAQIRGIAKSNESGPFTIANEVVAARIGQALGLPIPAGVLAEHDRDMFYLSLDVSKEGKALPPVEPRDFVAEEPRWAAGCVVFDVLIANPDRHAANVARDESFTPPRVSLFDHGHALLGTHPPPLGVDRLRALNDELGCDGTKALGNRHVFLDLLRDDGPLWEWVDRVESLPDYVIRDACGDAQSAPINLDSAGARELAEWLTARRASIRGLIASHQHEFTALTAPSMFWDHSGAP